MIEKVALLFPVISMILSGCLYASCVSWLMPEDAGTKFRPSLLALSRIQSLCSNRKRRKSAAETS